MKNFPSNKALRKNLGGFSLLEILVSCSILMVILAILFSTLSRMSELWTSSNNRIEAFQSARIGFETMTRMLSQATLNTYWEYDNPNHPTRYIRKSELHFLVGDAATLLENSNCYGQAVFFQAPANHNPPSDKSEISTSNPLPGLLNACGFFVEFCSEEEKGWLPAHVVPAGKKRFRLMQWVERSGDLAVYQTDASNDSRAWIRAAQEAIPIADNVITLIIAPKEPDRQGTFTLPDQYAYDSRENADANPQPANAHQLPPILQIAMVAIDEASAARLGDSLQSTIAGCLAGLFQDSPRLKFDEDLKRLEDALTAQRINYRIFVSTIPLYEAKWSPQP